jgi:deazaflavin-dependent oxidoreductase (nitroreductase family)
VKLQDWLNKVSNPLMKVILRSPLHGLLSGSILLITFTGRKSGKVYTTPVNYHRDRDVLTVVSWRNRTWWRNLRGGAPVTLRLPGKDVQGTGDVVEDPQSVVACLAKVLQRAPRYARFYHVTLDPKGQPTAEDASRFGQERVVIQIRLSSQAQ